MPTSSDALREVRLALLEADVALPVVKEFIAAVRTTALGEEVVGSLTPGQALVGVVHRELAGLMGGGAAPLDLATQPPAVILLAGLAGLGQDDHRGEARAAPARAEEESARRLHRRLPAGGDLTSCKTLAQQVGVDFFPSAMGEQPVAIAEAALDWAKKHYHDVLIVDTAGRLAIDEAMMREIAMLHAAMKPIETLFIVDAMQGQDAVNTARAFRDALPLTGVILTKLDGDARGGAALSVRHVTGAPIKFVGVVREDRRARGVPSGADGVAHPRHGRRAVADRGRAQDRRSRRGGEAREEGQVRQGLRSRGFQGADRARCARWADSPG